MRQSLTYYRTAGYKIVARMSFNGDNQRVNVQCWVYSGGLPAKMQINLSPRQLAAKLEPGQVPDEIRKDAEARFARLKVTEAERKRNERLKHVQPEGLSPVKLARETKWG